MVATAVSTNHRATAVASNRMAKDKDKDKAAKIATARTLWVPAINNHGGFGRWAFIEVSDPWDAKNLIRSFLKQAPAKSTKEIAYG